MVVLVNPVGTLRADVLVTRCGSFPEDRDVVPRLPGNHPAGQAYCRSGAVRITQMSDFRPPGGAGQVHLANDATATICDRLSVIPNDEARRLLAGGVPRLRPFPKAESCCVTGRCSS